MEYSKAWIKKVRNGMKKCEFCKHIYVFKKNGKVCQNIHRNTLSNWENGRTSLSRDIETFLSLVLWEYDHFNEIYGYDIVTDKNSRNERYQYAKACLHDVLDVDFYCRNLHDALLIQVTRGIISFEDVPELEKSLEDNLGNYPITIEEKNGYAIERNTVSISSDLSKVNDVNSLIELITVTHKNSFAAARIIIGARLNKIYESRDRYPKKVDLQKAIVNLAPNYRHSYVRMFNSSFISRDWLIDLCVHLHFNRKEINSMLDAAHMVGLSNDEFVNSLDENSDVALNVDSNVKFSEKSLINKLKIMLILGENVSYMDELTEGISVERILESFSIYDQGENVVYALNRSLEDNENIKSGKMADQYEKSLEDVWENVIIKNVYDVWVSYIEMVGFERDIDEDLQNMRKKTWRFYVEIDRRLVIDEEYHNQFKLLHFLTAMYYSILLNKRYEGKLTEQDLSEIKKLFDMDDSIQCYIYKFISTMLGLFLGNNEIYVKEGGKDFNGQYYPKFYTLNPLDKRPSKALDLNEILEDIFEAIISLEE